MLSASIQHSRFSRSLRKENEPSSHTKAHVAYYAEQNRLRLFGLTRLASKGFRERFEKRNLRSPADRLAGNPRLYNRRFSREWRYGFP